MSDTRFIMLGVALIFAGFVVLGVLGSDYAGSTIEEIEFGDCYEYYDDMPPVPVSCDQALLNKMLFFMLVIGLVATGIISLIKGSRGKWDQDVRPEDMVGPGGEKNLRDDEKDD